MTHDSRPRSSRAGRSGRATPAPAVRVGSKTFTESVILGEIASSIDPEAGAPAVHRRELGGTQVLFHALEAGELDVYPEYTGTISGEILAARTIRGEDALRAALAERGVGMSRPLGFNNTYAIGMREEVAARLGMRTLSDLRRHPELRFGFSNEFMERADGWPGLRDRYGLPQRDVRGLDHDLAYRALDERRDPGDRPLFDRCRDPGLQAPRARRRPAASSLRMSASGSIGPTCRRGRPAAFAALARLEGRISRPRWPAMNARAKIDRGARGPGRGRFRGGRSSGSSPRSESKAMLGTAARDGSASTSPWWRSRSRRRSWWRSRSGSWPRAGPGWARSSCPATGVIQTIPSLALLVFMIPWLGIGAKPALVALVPVQPAADRPEHRHGPARHPAVAPRIGRGHGIAPAARLLRIELPMASRAILAGIKTAAVINVGTATIGP